MIYVFLLLLDISPNEERQVGSHWQQSTYDRILRLYQHIEYRMVGDCHGEKGERAHREQLTSLANKGYSKSHK
jgi:hypothetical protein